MADRRLQVFYTVSRMMSFTKAADVLQMTQPAVTFQIRQLEEHFKARLFDRSHNKIDLTEAGKRVYQYAERIFGLYGEMENSLRDVTKQVSGVVRVGACASAAEYLLPELFASFQAKYPEVQLRLKVCNTQNVISLIENSFSDIGIVESAVRDKKLVVETFQNDEMVLIMSPEHTLSGSDTVAVSDLVELPWVMREEDSGTRELVVEHLTQCGLEFNNLKVVMELGSPEAVKGAVIAGTGVSIMPLQTIKRELALGVLSCAHLDPVLERPLSLVYKKQKYQLRLVDELLGYIADYTSGALEDEAPVKSSMDDSEGDVNYGSSA